jgi:hypothetical protein
MYQSRLVSKEIAHLSTTNAQNIFNAISNMAQLFPALAKEKGETLPFATFVNFEALAIGARRLAKAESIIYMPLLKTQDELDQWGNYSFIRTDWMDRGRTFNFGSETKYSSSNETDFSSEVLPYVFSFSRGPPPMKRFPVSIVNGSYASPIWQMYVVCFGPVGVGCLDGWMDGRMDGWIRCYYALFSFSRSSYPVVVDIVC